MRILSFKSGEVKNFGGINKTVMELNNELVVLGHECIIITTNTLNLPETEEYNGIKIIRINPELENLFYGLNLGIYKYFKRNWKDLNPDIVHIHGYHGISSLEIIYLIRKLDENIPIVFSPYLDTFRSTYAGKYLWNIFNHFGKKSFEKSTKIVSCSNYEKFNLERLNVYPQKISVIPLGIDKNEIFHGKYVKKGPFKLIYSGFLVKRKGVHFILESLYSLIYELGFTDVVLVIVGDGPEKKNLLNLSKKLKLDKYVIWKSFLDRKEFINEIAKSDLFMLLSESEAYGITIAETLSLGTPCIVTNKTALSEFLDEPGCFGVDFPPNPKKVASLIFELNKKDVKVGPFSRKIRSWEEVSRDYEKLYLECISKKD